MKWGIDVETPVNINTNTRVKLTEYGLEVLIDHYEKINLPHEYRRLPDENGYFETQLWEVMAIFGKYIHIGMVDIPFDKNEIILVSDVFDNLEKGDGNAK